MINADNNNSNDNNSNYISTASSLLPPARTPSPQLPDPSTDPLCAALAQARRDIQAKPKGNKWDPPSIAMTSSAFDTEEEKHATEEMKHATEDLKGVSLQDCAASIVSLLSATASPSYGLHRQAWRPEPAKTSPCFGSKASPCSGSSLNFLALVAEAAVITPAR